MIISLSIYIYDLYALVFIDHFRNVLFMTLRTDMSHVRISVIIYHTPLWDRKRYCQRAIATFELCGWILEWLTIVS